MAEQKKVKKFKKKIVDGKYYNPKHGKRRLVSNKRYNVDNPKQGNLETDME